MSDNVDVVESDNFAAGSEALKHLIALGHRNIGFLMGPKSTSTSYGRLAGARAVQKERPIELGMQSLSSTLGAKPVDFDVECRRKVHLLLHLTF